MRVSAYRRLDSGNFCFYSVFVYEKQAPSTMKICSLQMKRGARVHKNTRLGDGRRLFMTHFKRRGRLSEFANEHLARASKALPRRRRRKLLHAASLLSVRGW